MFIPRYIRSRIDLFSRWRVGNPDDMYGKCCCNGNTYVCTYLVDLNRCVDDPSENQACSIADGAREGEECEADNEVVTKIKKCGCELVDIQLDIEVVCGIEEHPEGC